MDEEINQQPQPQPQPQQRPKTAKDRIINIGAVTIIKPIQENARELKQTNAKDLEVISEMREQNLHNLKFNNPPRKLEGTIKAHGNGMHPLADKIDKEIKESRKKHLKLDTFTRVGNLLTTPTNNAVVSTNTTGRPLTASELREQRLKYLSANL
jgi:hypothetical protein